MPQSECNHAQPLAARRDLSDVAETHDDKRLEAIDSPDQRRLAAEEDFDRIAEQVVVAQWRVNWHLVKAQKPDAAIAFAEVVLQHSCADGEEFQALRPRPQYPFDVDLVNEQRLVHQTNLFQRSSGEQAPGSHEELGSKHLCALVEVRKPHPQSVRLDDRLRELGSGID